MSGTAPRVRTSDAYSQGPWSGPETALQCFENARSHGHQTALTSSPGKNASVRYRTGIRLWQKGHSNSGVVIWNGPHEFSQREKIASRFPLPKCARLEKVGTEN